MQANITAPDSMEQTYTLRQLLYFTLKHLRFSFSFFLLPVFLFALSTVQYPFTAASWVAFFTLHFLVYPSSNGYNSYMDQDKGSIGGLEKPPPAPVLLLLVSILMDALALAIVIVFSPMAAIVLLLYIMASRAYSWRKIRLKKYPVIGYLTVVVFQGAAVFYFTLLMADPMYYISYTPNLQGMLGIMMSLILIGSSYPLTQVYQHKQDRLDGVKTVSMLLGIRGTFVLSVIMLIFFTLLLFIYLWLFGRRFDLLIFALCSAPSMLFFQNWFSKVRKDKDKADFRHTMKMSLIGAGGLNIFFLYLTFLQYLL